MTETAHAVLFVDDDESNLVTVRYAFDDRYEVLTATSGEEALRLLAENPDIAVLVCDQRMPGMTGTEVCERARELRPEVVRMILTAYVDQQDAIAAINRGQVSRYILKPFRNADLAEALDQAIELVRSRRSTDELQSRLLHSIQSETARVVRFALAHDIDSYGEPLAVELESASTILVALEDPLSPGAAPNGSRPALRALSRHLRRARLAVDQLVAMAANLRHSERETAAPIADVARVVRATIAIASGVDAHREVGIEFRPEGEPRVAMDPAELGQVVMNLLRNAVRAARSARKPNVDPAVTIRVASIRDGVAIQITDTGPGMPPDRLDKLFDAARHSIERDGRGFGLSIVHDLVTRAGGRVECTSPPGAGATFTVYLPRADGDSDSG